MRIQVMLDSGRTERLDVEDVLLVMECHHCQHEFLTSDPRQKYCNPNHRKLAENSRYKIRTVLGN